jgi:zinc transport system substrate-binding protein
MKNLKRLLVFCLALLGLCLAGCGEAPKQETAPGKIPVVVSFEAMRELTEAIGGDKVSIDVLNPPGAEVHAFDPKAGDIMKIRDAKVFIMNGCGMEPWGDRAVKAARHPSLIAVKAASDVEPIRLPEGGTDPHTWLGPKEGKLEARAICRALSQASPENKEYFEKREQELEKELDALINEYEPVFQKSSHKTFITGHAAFGYVCRDFGLEQKSVEDVFASGEPTAKNLIALIESCKADDIHALFMEDFMDPALARTIEKEAGVKAVPIDTMENQKDDGSYIDHMRNNIKEIASYY